jgi:RNA 2',3'-cyclic 3'-phosphodiesterase
MRFLILLVTTIIERPDIPQSYNDDKNDCKPGTTLSNTIRCFIAIELPAEIKDELARIIKILRENIPDGIRWIPVDNIHLTLKFLGDVKIDHIDLIKNVITKSVNSIPPFKISLTKVGAFPNITRPHVIWLGLEAPGDLAELVDRINIQTDEIGYPSESRPFSPHLTLGRVSKTIDSNQMKQISAFLKNNELKISKTGLLTNLILYRSDLIPTGAIYNRLFLADLSNS